MIHDLLCVIGVVAYVVGVPVLVAYLICRRDPCHACGRVAIHRPDCTGHFDA